MPTFRHRSKLYQTLLFGLPLLAIILVVVVVIVLMRQSIQQHTDAGASVPESTMPVSDQSAGTSALQRNARNVKAANDANSLMASLMEYVSNNNGALPETLQTTADGQLQICGASCASGSPSTVKLQYYENSTTGVQFQALSTNLEMDDLHSLHIVNGASCDQNQRPVAASSRSIAVLYAIDDGTKTVPRCVSS